MNVLSYHCVLSAFLHFWDFLGINTLRCNYTLSTFLSHMHTFCISIFLMLMHGLSMQSRAKPHCFQSTYMSLARNLTLSPTTILSFLSLFIFHAWNQHCVKPQCQAIPMHKFNDQSHAKPKVYLFSCMSLAHGLALSPYQFALVLSTLWRLSASLRFLVFYFLRSNIFLFCHFAVSFVDGLEETPNKSQSATRGDST